MLQKEKKQNGKIEVLYIGNSRGDKFNQRLVEIFGWDDRFNFTLAGKFVNTSSLMSKVKDLKNITVLGEYNDDKKKELLTNADMIINMNTASFNGKRLTANKYYDGLLYLLPQLARIDEYTGALVSCKELGVALDFDDTDFANKVYEYYQNLDMEYFVQKSKAELKRVKEQNEIFVQKITEKLLKNHKKHCRM